MKLPAYGIALLDARRAGARPARPVVVTDCWAVAKMYQESDYFALVCAPPEAPYDFTLLYDLDVMLMMGSDDVLGIAERIAQAKPERFSVSTRPEVLQVFSNLRAELGSREDPRAQGAHRALRELVRFEAPAA